MYICMYICICIYMYVVGLTDAAGGLGAQERGVVGLRGAQRRHAAHRGLLLGLLRGRPTPICRKEINDTRIMSIMSQVNALQWNKRFTVYSICLICTENNRLQQFDIRKCHFYFEY